MNREGAGVQAVHSREVQEIAPTYHQELLEAQGSVGVRGDHTHNGGLWCMPKGERCLVSVLWAWMDRDPAQGQTQDL